MRAALGTMIAVAMIGPGSAAFADSTVPPIATPVGTLTVDDGLDGAPLEVAFTGAGLASDLPPVGAGLAEAPPADPAATAIDQPATDPSMAEQPVGGQGPSAQLDRSAGRPGLRLSGGGLTSDLDRLGLSLSGRPRPVGAVVPAPAVAASGAAPTQSGGPLAGTGTPLGAGIAGLLLMLLGILFTWRRARA